MNKTILKSTGMLVALAMLLFLLSGCAGQTPATVTAPTQTSASETQSAATSQTGTQPTATAAAVTLPTFTAEELAKYDGQNGNRAYIAVDGKVYDVTDVPQWKNGTHAGGRFQAGVDQTAALAQAPHSAALLGNVPIVGLFQ